MSVRGSTEVTPVKTSESKVEYTRGDIVEWYINSPLGIEQGFTLNSRPEKSAGESTFKLRIDLETSKQLQVKAV